MTSDLAIRLLAVIVVFGFFLVRLWAVLREYQARRRAYVMGLVSIVLFPALGLYLAWVGAPWLVATAVAVFPAIGQLAFAWQILVVTHALEPLRGTRFAFGRLVAITPREVPPAMARRRIQRELSALDAWRTNVTADLIDSTRTLYSSWFASETESIDVQHAARDQLEAFLRDPFRTAT